MRNGPPWGCTPLPGGQCCSCVPSQGAWLGAQGRGCCLHHGPPPVLEEEATWGAGQDIFLGDGQGEA